MANATPIAFSLPTSNFCGDKIHAYLPFSDERMLIVYEDKVSDIYIVCDADADVSNDMIGNGYYPTGWKHFQACETLEHALHVAATWARTQEPEYVYPRA